MQPEETIRLSVVSPTEDLNQATNSNESNNLLSGFRLVTAMCSFSLLMMLAGLDLTIVAAALVTITSHFNAVSDIAWMTSIIFIVQTGLLLLCGKLLNIMPPKIILLVSSGILVLGNLFCAIAPSINFLIFGRAITGVGGTGIWLTILAIIGRISTWSQRPILIGLTVNVYAMCSVLGPIIGGVLSARVSWRWCFYINLPIGGVAIVSALLFVPNLPSLTVHKKSAWDTWLKLDWIGTFLNLLGVFLFLTGLQWGGNTRPWRDAGVIATIVFGVIALCLFFFWEARKGPEAILSTAMLRRPNILGSSFLSGFMHWSIVLLTFYLPIIFQLRGHSVIQSGIDILPFAGSGIIGSLISGAFVSITGRAWLWLFLPPLLGVVAFGLLVGSNIETSLARLIGYQVLIGFGIGPAIQNCFVMAQAEYADEEDLVPQATSLISFAGYGFSGIGLAICGTVFSGVLNSQVKKLNLDLPDPLRTLVLENIDVVLALPEDLRTPLVRAYLKAVNRVFIVGIVVTALGGLSALLIQRKKISVKRHPVPQRSSRRRPAKESSTCYIELLKTYMAEPYEPLLPS